METTTYGARIDQYEWRKGLTTWVGAGYAALIALMNAKLLERAPVFAAIAFLGIIIGGGLLAFARVGFEWKVTELRRRIKGTELTENSELLPEHKPWPASVETCWRRCLSTI